MTGGFPGSGVLGQRERVEVRVEEPRDAGTARRCPDPQVVLLEAVVPHELDAPAGQLADRGRDVGDVPSTGSPVGGARYSR
jgi:hypothetical protein